MITNSGDRAELCLQSCKAWSERTLLRVSAARSRINSLMIIGGILLLVSGMSTPALAGTGDGQIVPQHDSWAEAVRAILSLIEGAFGALVLVAAGVGALVSAAFGQYRAALSLMVVAISSFVLRSLMEMFFNTTAIKNGR